MLLKAKSIILKAFPTYGSNFSSITFELHFDYIFLHIFAIGKIQNSRQKLPKHNKTKWKNGKNSGKNSAKVAKIKFCYGTDGS